MTPTQHFLLCVWPVLAVMLFCIYMWAKNEYRRMNDFFWPLGTGFVVGLFYLIAFLVIT